MGKPHPMELRVRVAAFVEEGNSHREAARHFGVSPRFVNNLMKLKAETGSLAARQQGHSPGAGKLGGHADFVRGLVEENGEVTLDELCVALEGRGVTIHRSNVGRLLHRLGLSHKKVASSQRAPAPRDQTGARALDQAAQALLRQGPRAARLHRRNLDQHAAEQAYRMGAERRALPRPCAVRRLEDADLHRRSALSRHGRAPDRRCADEQGPLRDLDRDPNSRRNCRPAMSSSSTMSPSTRASAPPNWFASAAHGSCRCRLTPPISTPSRWHSQSSRRCSESVLRNPSTPSAMPSRTSATSSILNNAETSSRQQDTRPIKCDTL
jgi:transposase